MGGGWSKCIMYTPGQKYTLAFNSLKLCVSAAISPEYLSEILQIGAVVFFINTLRTEYPVQPVARRYEILVQVCLKVLVWEA